ncbi:M13 family metallopeptidase [Methylomonas rosea]|uniref:M13 family metallopeptidase n=1 Tax=Methylomonas rosea TaxID=2952227 RepID=A0ABT1TXR2_9GAMM|nr:M13 family metallopeptidase [Methylomonas sp. WSC-7]MCQ8119557.1 M13 family metallopeptidase [Methylomonas sp. WSC-7]
MAKRKHTEAQISASLWTLPTLLMTGCLAVTGCNQTTKPEPTAEQSPQTTAQPTAQTKNWGIDTQNIAKDIQPGDDFYRYVNKGWLDTAKIPQGLSGVEAFTELRLSTEKQIAAIIQEAVNKNAQPGSSQQKIADLYTSYLDIAGRNQRGISSLKADLDNILSTNSRSELAGKMAKPAYGSLFATSPTIDSGNPQKYILEILQSGLGLPNRDYYLRTGEPFAGHRKAYLSYIEGALQRAELPNAKQRAKAIFDFEMKLAKHHWSSEQKRDPIKRYHVMSKEQLIAYAPGFDWADFLAGAGFGDVNTVQATTDSAVKGMAAVYAKTPVGTLRDYVAFHYLNNHAGILSDAWVDAGFDLFSRRLQGIPQPRPLEERAVEFVNTVLGEQIGKLYVARHFPPESKAKTLEMVSFIVDAMKEHLQKLDWMDEITRKAALEKLASFTVQIGYPEQWHDYSTVKMTKDDLVGNIHAVSKWKRDDAIAQLREPVRRWEWGHDPQEINAFYSPDLNEIVFLAAILQPPFFNPEADPAVNFGAIGAVIGHEISHGFDDQGSQYDGSGRLRNWWQKASRQNFEAKTKRLVTQYNAYEPIQGLHLNGQLTLGENIGDMGGVSLAYTAYQKYAAARYPNGEAPVLDGFTGNQRFFLGFAQVWRNKATDDLARMLAMIDVHSPGQFRTNGILRNFDPWYEAFGVSKEHALYLPKEDRISIW